MFKRRENKAKSGQLKIIVTVKSQTKAVRKLHAVQQHMNNTK